MGVRGGCDAGLSGGGDASARGRVVGAQTSGDFHPLPNSNRLPAFRSADRSTKDPHIVAACNLSGLFRCEAAAQHRRDELHPLRVILHAARGDLLVGAALASLNHACRDHRPDVSATLTTMAFDHSSLRWLEINT
jgi:hypothetical protein